MAPKRMSKWTACFWQNLFKMVLGGGYGAKVHYAERLPMEGAYIVAPNHTSNFDPPLLGMAVKRPVYLMAKEELFRNPILKTIITWLGAFPLRRGVVDKIAIRSAMEILKRGDLLGIFPQGTRVKEGTFQQFHDGMASMALRTGVPIIPITIIGSGKMKRGKIHIVIGNPIYVEKGKPTKEAISSVNKEVQMAMYSMYVEIATAYGLPLPDKQEEPPVVDKSESRRD